MVAVGGGLWAPLIPDPGAEGGIPVQGQNEKGVHGT